MESVMFMVDKRIILKCPFASPVSMNIEQIKKYAKTKYVQWIRCVSSMIDSQNKILIPLNLMWYKWTLNIYRLYSLHTALHMFHSVECFGVTNIFSHRSAYIANHKIITHIHAAVRQHINGNTEYLYSER